MKSSTHRLVAMVIGSNSRNYRSLAMSSRVCLMTFYFISISGPFARISNSMKSEAADRVSRGIEQATFQYTSTYLSQNYCLLKMFMQQSMQDQIDMIVFQFNFDAMCRHAQPIICKALGGSSVISKYFFRILADISKVQHPKPNVSKHRFCIHDTTLLNILGLICFCPSNNPEGYFCRVWSAVWQKGWALILEASPRNRLSGDNNSVNSLVLGAKMEGGFYTCTFMHCLSIYYQQQGQLLIRQSIAHQLIKSVSLLRFI